MRRTVAALFLLVLASATGAAGEDVPAKAALAFRALQREYFTSFDAADTAVRRREVMARYAPRFLEHAEKNAKSPTAFSALVVCVQASTEKGGPGDKALAILERDHPASPGMRRVVQQCADRADEAGGRVCKAVLEKSPDVKVRARACKALADSREECVRLADEMRGNARQRGAISRKRGRDFVRNVLANEERHRAEAREYRKLFTDRYAALLPDLSIGKVAPEVVSRGLDGKAVKLSGLRGKVVVLDVWATWCGPCRAMIPHEREMVKRFEGRPFVLVSISADARAETVRDFLKKEPMPWTHWWNGPRGGIVEDWEVEAFPTIYVLDSKGVIRFKDIRDRRLEGAVKDLLDEAEEERKKD